MLEFWFISTIAGIVFGIICFGVVKVAMDYSAQYNARQYHAKMCEDHLADIESLIDLVEKSKNDSYDEEGKHYVRQCP